MYHKNCQECNSNYTTNDKKSKFCCLSCSCKKSGRDIHDRTRTKYELNPKLCKECNTALTWEQRKENKFCSSRCGAVHTNRLNPQTRTEEQKENLRQKNYQRNIDNPPIKYSEDKNCIICEAIFIVNSKSKKVKTCGPACTSKLQSERAKANPNCGGSTKQYILYKGVSLDSSWEHKLALSLDENNVKWERPTFFRLSNGRRYTPDFYLPDYNIYLDPKAFRKGYFEQVKKIQLFETDYNVRCIVLGIKQLDWKDIEPLTQSS